MVHDKLVSLDEPIRDLLPEVPDFPAEITLLHLATHTSGLPRLPSNIIWSILRHPRNPYTAYNANVFMPFLYIIDRALALLTMLLMHTQILVWDY